MPKDRFRTSCRRCKGFVSIEDSGDLLVARSEVVRCALVQGSDTIYGDLGYDLVDGGDEADIIYGGQGSDQLYGGEGADIISGNQKGPSSNATPAGTLQAMPLCALWHSCIVPRL